MTKPPDFPTQSTEPTEPKENDVFKVSEITEDFKNIRMGFGQFHFTLELKQDVAGGLAALQDEMKKLGLEKRYIGTLRIASEGEHSQSSMPLTKGIYYCRYWKGKNGIHAAVQTQSEKMRQDELYKSTGKKSNE